MCAQRGSFAADSCDDLPVLDLRLLANVEVMFDHHERAVMGTSSSQPARAATRFPPSTIGSHARDDETRRFDTRARTGVRARSEQARQTPGSPDSSADLRSNNREAMP